jgi:hypothetical protein
MSNPISNGVQMTTEKSMRLKLHGLTVACPFNQCNPESCLLCGIRKRPQRERFLWVESLTPEALKETIEKHCICLQTREAEEARKFYSSPPVADPSGI